MTLRIQDEVQKLMTRRLQQSVGRELVVYYRSNREMSFFYLYFISSLVCVNKSILFIFNRNLDYFYLFKYNNTVTEQMIKSDIHLKKVHCI